MDEYFARHYGLCPNSRRRPDFDKKAGDIVLLKRKMIPILHRRALKNFQNFKFLDTPGSLDADLVAGPTADQSPADGR